MRVFIINGRGVEVGSVNVLMTKLDDVNMRA